LTSLTLVLDSSSQPGNNVIVFDLDCFVRLFAAGISQIPVEAREVVAANLAVITAEFV